MTNQKKYKKDLRFESIQERDMDMLLIEEFYSNEAFSKKAFEYLFGVPAQGAPQVLKVEHSVRANFRQMDFVVHYEGSYEVFFENKIGAKFQDQQIESYLAQAKGSSKKRVCIIAPEKYLQADEYSDECLKTLSYETVAGWLADTLMARDQRRCEHRVKMIEQAIDKQRRGRSAHSWDMARFFGHVELDEVRTKVLKSILNAAEERNLTLRWGSGLNGSLLVCSNKTGKAWFNFFRNGLIEVNIDYMSNEEHKELLRRFVRSVYNGDPGTDISLRHIKLEPTKWNHETLLSNLTGIFDEMAKLRLTGVA